MDYVAPLPSLPAFCCWLEALTPPTHSRFEKLNGHAKGAAGMIGLFKNPY